MNHRTLFFVAMAAVGVAVNALIACGPVRRYPSCGEYHRRATDGNYCRECVDSDGSRYGECHS